MKQITLLTGTIALLALAACDTGTAPARDSAAEPATDETTVVADDTGTTTSEAVTEGEATPDAQPSPEFAQDAPMAMQLDDGIAAPVASIPASYLGQWDLADGPCAPGSEMFLTIRPGTMTFYESQGEVTAVRRENGGIVVTLAMTGEGESWTREYGMTLQRGREQLAIGELSASGTGTVLTRCAVERNEPPASAPIQ